MAMKQELLGKPGHGISFWQSSSKMDIHLHTSENGNGNGSSDYTHKNIARSHRTRPASGRSFDRGRTASEDLTASVSDVFTSDGSSGIATPSMDGDYPDAESQKSQSSFSSDPSYLSLKAQLMEAVISDMFSTISALKNAYIQLQSAHVPYDPSQLQVADKAVIAELKKLSELKHSYRERLAIIDSANIGHEQSDTTQEGQTDTESKHSVLKTYEGIISNFHTEIQKKNAVVENLKETLSNTILKKEKLERKVKRLEQRLARDSATNSISTSPTPQLLESSVLGASEACRSFTKLLISHMKTAEWDLDAAANSIEPDIVYARKTHKKFAFESYVCHRMLNGFESESFTLSGVATEQSGRKQEFFNEFQELSNADPAEIVKAKPECLFAKFSLKKFLDVVHPKMDESFFGNLEHRKQVSNGSHPNSHFYQSFLKLAKAMWLLHRLAFSFQSSARIFQVKRGSDFSPLYMESIVHMVELDAKTSGAKPRVGFTVMPGFRVENTIIKCQVYVTGIRSTNV